MAAVSGLEAVCRAECQRVLTALRGNRRFGDLSRSWRELEEQSPVRQLVEWRCGSDATAAALLKPLLRIVRSPEFAGPSTFVALEAVHAVIMVLCEKRPEGFPLASTLCEVTSAVCGCSFEETHPQTDEAVGTQMITVLAGCATMPFGVDPLPAEECEQAFVKILLLWGHYKSSSTLRAGAQGALLRMLDTACATCHLQQDSERFLRAILGRMAYELGRAMPSEKVLLYARCVQRLALHAYPWLEEATPNAQIWLLQEAVPGVLAVLAEHFGTNISALSMVLPAANRIMWLGAGQGASSSLGLSLGALQIEALMLSVYIKTLQRSSAPLQPSPDVGMGSVVSSASSQGELSPEEGAELLVVLLESLCDLLQPGFVRMLWYTFDADWRRPPLLDQLVQAVMVLFAGGPSTERPLPAYVVHLSSTVLVRVVSAFVDVSDTRADNAEAAALEEEYVALQEQWSRREQLQKLMAAIEEKPKKFMGLAQNSGLLEHVPAETAHLVANDGEVNGEHAWCFKLAWIFRCCNYCVPYAAMGEIFGLNLPESEHIFKAFSESFNFGAEDLDQSLRSLCQAFLLPKEAQMIDRLLKNFSVVYYRKHLEQSTKTGQADSVYLRAEDAAYTLSFSVILLNSDQHNPKLKKRMELKDFLRNNEGINEGGDLPKDVQGRIFENIRNDEIKTPNSGSFLDGASRTRLRDLAQLSDRGYRDNAVSLEHGRLPAHARGLMDKLSSQLRATLEAALAADAGANSDAADGLQALLLLTLQQGSPEADAVAEGLFFFGTEVFHDQQGQQFFLQQGADASRASDCLRALFHTSRTFLDRLSPKQAHMLVYITVQFALQGLAERALGGVAPEDAATGRLLRSPGIAVEPPTGAVYSFLRKISTVPFRMLQLKEEVEERSGSNSMPPAGAVPAASAARPPSASTASAQDEDKQSVATTATTAAPESESQEREPLMPPLDARASEQGASAAGSSAGQVSERSRDAALSAADSEAASDAGEQAAQPGEAPADPLRPQVERAYESCGFDAFVRSMASLPKVAPEQLPTPTSASQLSPSKRPASTPADALLSYLSGLFLALRNSGAGAVKTPGGIKEQDMPWYPEAEGKADVSAPQGLQLPRRALALNVRDGYDTLRFALRLTLSTIGSGGVQRLGSDVLDIVWDAHVPPTSCMLMLQEVCITSHAGLLQMLSRTDLSERTLRLAIVATFQTAATLTTCLRRGKYWEECRSWSSVPPKLLMLMTVSWGSWPVRLLETLVRRTDTEPQFLIPVAKLCLEATRLLVTEIFEPVAGPDGAQADSSRSVLPLREARALERLWRQLFSLLLRALPTAARALWPGPKDAVVKDLQAQIWKHGLVWLLGHPSILSCVDADLLMRPISSVAASAPGSPTPPEPAAAEALAAAGASSPAAKSLARPASMPQLPGAAPAGGAAAAAGNAQQPPQPQAPSSFWAWALSELTAVAEEMHGGSKEATRPLLLDTYKVLVGHILHNVKIETLEPIEDEIDCGAASGVKASEEPQVSSRQEVGKSILYRGPAAQAAVAWARIIASLLNFASGLLGRRAAPADEGETQLVSLLKSLMLDSRVSPLLGAAPQGSHWARQILEKLVTALTSAASSGAPIPVLREAVPLVAKFFLLNLSLLRRHEHFSQLWLMVLRLMTLFIKRGTDDRDVELEEEATESLKNLLGVLLNTRILGFVSGGGKDAGQVESGQVPVWWQMTWNCIEVFLPGFSEEFRQSAAGVRAMGSHAAAAAAAAAANGIAAKGTADTVEPAAAPSADAVRDAAAPADAES